MSSGTIRRRHSDLGTDWLAEFTSEEQRGGKGSAADEEARQARLIDLEPQRSGSDDHVRLIPTSAWPAPVVPTTLPPPRQFFESDDMSLLGTLERAGRYGLTIREGATLGIAATAIVAAMVMAAALLWQWNQTAQQAGASALLTSAPAPSSLEWQAPAALPTSPLPVGETAPRPGTPDVPLQSPASAKTPVSSKLPVSGPAQRTSPSGSPARVAASGPLAAAATTPTPTPPPVPATTPTPTPSPMPVQPPPAQDLTMPPATLYVAPPVATLGASLASLRPVAEPAVPSAAAERAVQTAAVRSVLDRYRLAFSTLSVDGLGTVWRTVDTKALSKAFGQLETQTVEFDACQIDINGELAEAACSGRTSFVPKVGARAPRVDSRRWTFQLARVRGGWVIDRVESR